MENDRYENALRLRQEGYSLQQIGNMLGISKSTVFRLLEEPDAEEEVEDPLAEWDNHIGALEQQVFTLQNLLQDILVKQSEESVKRFKAEEQKAQYLITSFQKILANVYEQVKLKTWKVSDYEDCVKQIEKLKSQLAYYAFNVLNTDHEELVIWVYLTKLQSKITRMLTSYKSQIIPILKLKLKLSSTETEELERMKQLETVNTIVNTKPT